MPGNPVKWARFISGFDLHYLVIPFVFSLLMVLGLGALRQPTTEFGLAAMWAVGSNAVMIVLSFVGLAPWEFSRPWRHVVMRCGSWIVANFVAGSILAFVIVSARAWASLVLEVVT
jgi:hypothetical protein